MEKAKLKELVASMTLGEKIAQMTQITGEHYVGVIDDEMVETGPGYSEEVLSEQTLYAIGSVIGASSAKVTNLIQKTYLDKARVKVPLLFMHDAIHGYKTIFPIPLALSCSWDTEILEKVAAYTGQELRSSGIHVNFSPMADLTRDARWGRVMEGFGEDHVLTGELGAAMVRGYQKNGVAATLKHFAAYGAPIAGRDYNAVDMSWREFFSYYAKPYEKVLEAKPKFVMTSFNSLDGIPVTASETVMKEILREKYGFEGIVISDWGAVSELQNHRVAHDGYEAAALGLKAGVDIEMVSTTYLENYEVILKNNPELLAYIDEAVLKIVELKAELGLFDNPYTEEAKEDEVLLNANFLSFAKESAKRSMVLLKNEESTLPIKADKQNILLIGPFAKTNELLGNWACKGKFQDVTSLEVGMKQIFGSRFLGAYETLEEVPEKMKADADFIVVTLGESWEKSGEGHSSVNLELEETQKELLTQIKGLNIPYACVGFSGRPLALESSIADMPALLWAWYGGTRTGEAVAELLAGADSPSGKLTMSFPRHSAQAPLYYNEYSSGRPANDSSYSNRYQDSEVGPLFLFGYGLSYADIKYANFLSDSENITAEKPVTFSFEITNNSDYDLKETAILFIEDKVSKTIRPIREMKKWQIVALKPNETKKVSFELNLSDLTYLNTKLEEVVENGEFNIYINSLDEPKFTIRY